MKYIFTIPDRNSNRFRCEIYKNGEYMYSREVHLYNKEYSDEMNVTILSKKMSDTLNITEQKLNHSIRMAVLLGKSELLYY